MKKEMTIAISFGLLVGLVLTIGAYRARRAIESVPKVQSARTLAKSTPATPQMTATVSQKLAIKQPKPNSIQTQKDNHISGKTIPNTLVVLLIADKEFLSTSDTIGNFSFPITLTDTTTLYTINVLPENEPPITLSDSIFYEVSKASASAKPTKTL